MPSINRRQLLRGLAGAGAVAVLPKPRGESSSPAGRTKPDRERIRRENAREGTTDWQLTYTRVDPKTRFRSPMIEGYVSRQSVRAGDTLEFFVSTNPAVSFTIDLYRLGYYGGRGGRHLRRLGPFKGQVQATPPVGPERLRECQWQPCTRLHIPDDWVSGVYLGKLSG